MKKIPIRLSPFFFLTAAIIGYMHAHSLVGTLIWVAIIFVSVLVHEFGHALVALAFNRKPQIELGMFGGLTVTEGEKLKLYKEFLVVIAGPLFGFSLFLIASIILQFPFQMPLLRLALENFRIVNFIWTLVNLLPVLPLDGGQLLRITLEAIFGAKAWKMAACASLFTSLLFAGFFFVMGGLLIGSLFLIFCYQSFENYRAMRFFTADDQCERYQENLKQAKSAIAQGKTEEAMLVLEALRSNTKQGILYREATELLAQLYFDEGKVQSSYGLLKELLPPMSSEAKLLLHVVAFDAKDYKLVAKLSGEAFRIEQTSALCMRNAKAYAQLGDVKRAIAWIKTADSLGDCELFQEIQDHEFDPLRFDQIFKKFISSIACK